MGNNIGTFELKTSRMLVTDPCYGKEIWCTYTITDAKPGIWEGDVVMSDEGVWGNRVAELHVRHTEDYATDPTEKIDTVIGVDSGQAGFFDLDEFPDCGGADDKFYNEACEVTLSKGIPAGPVSNMGIVSSSGFGDGGYSLYVGRNDKGEVISASLIFIDEVMEDDYD